jgi:hypothetical protein
MVPLGSRSLLDGADLDSDGTLEQGGGRLG